MSDLDMDVPVDWDRENDIVYVTLLPDDLVSWTKNLDDDRLIDYSADGRVVGVEFLDASAGISLTDVPFAHKIDELIRASGLPFKIYA